MPWISWNLLVQYRRRGISKRLLSLQEMDQRVKIVLRFGINSNKKILESLRCVNLITSLLFNGLKSSWDYWLPNGLPYIQDYVRSLSLLSTAFSIWNKMKIFYTALPLPRKVTSVLERTSTHSPNFIIETTSHVVFKCSL